MQDAKVEKTVEALDAKVNSLYDLLNDLGAIDDAVRVLNAAENDYENTDSDSSVLASCEAAAGKLATTIEEARSLCEAIGANLGALEQEVLQDYDITWS